jgi:tetratricopeptide (TPR) repeat protein
MTRFRPLMLTLATCGTLVLAGCESDEDKAERFYQAGLTLLEEGDKERAVIELRNVFNHDGFHKEARMLYADLVLELGRSTEAYGQYLRLIEQYPDEVEARVALAKMAMSQNNWEEVARHGEAAITLAPDQPDVQAIDVALKYRQAALDEDTDARIEAAEAAQKLLDDLRATEAPDNDGLVRLVLNNHVLNKDFDTALEAVNTALERTPDSEELNIFKISLLAETQDLEGTGDHLKKVVAMFPENIDVKRALVNWFMGQGDTDGAVAFLRDEAGDDTGPVAGHMQVIELLQLTQGADAARAELTRLRAANADTENGRIYAGMLATMDFQAGDRDKAIAEVRTAIDGSEEGEQKVRLQVILARMLETTGETEEARSLIDTVLESDTSNVPALRMRAAWLIAEDKPGEAIVALRAALDQNPRDADTLTLMAEAHERDGDTDLVGERLALAMEASNNAVPETLRYARFLVSQDRAQVALTVLEDARRRAPGNVQLIATIANLHLSANDWAAARALSTELRNLGGERAAQAATELEARILQGQNRTDDSLALLQGQLDRTADASTSEQIRAIGLIVQAQIRGGKSEAARQTLDEALAENPDSPDLNLLNAALYAVEGNPRAAEAIYRDLIATYPQTELPARLLVNMLAGEGRIEESRAALDAALAELPDNPNLLWIQASYLEGDGDFEGAIGIYEQLYALNSNSPVVANNLASLITTHRDDPESLTRAANIVRRLRDTDVPAFQDTYGWIAYRRNNFEEAVAYLEPAAAGLPQDALVQYHLGMTYVALGRTEDARAQLEKALELAGDSPLPQFQTARETLSTLE